MAGDDSLELFPDAAPVRVPHNAPLAERMRPRSLDEVVGQEARASLRGAIIGARDLMGGLGIMFAGFLGGVVFDAIGRTAPFTMMGILNAVLMVLALVVRFRAGAPSVENNDELQ